MLAGFGSLTEVQKQWTIEDVADAHHLLDLREEQEAKALAAAQSKRGR